MSKENYNETNSKEFNKLVRQGKIIPARDGMYWTDEERFQLKELFQQQGEDISEIARILQRTDRAIIQQLESMKLYKTPTKRSKKNTPKCPCVKCNPDCPCRN